MPNALAVDSDARKVFWGDARLDKIERVDMDNKSSDWAMDMAEETHDLGAAKRFRCFFGPRGILTFYFWNNITAFKIIALTL